MSCCHHHSCRHECGCQPSCCPYPAWMHPLLCNPAHLCCAENTNGPTLVIHCILLEPCGNQSCTPRNFTIRVTGPSYPGGETFTLRAGSCTELDEPLVIAGLTPGQYQIEQLTVGDCGHCGYYANCGWCSDCGCHSGCAGYAQYDTSFTGPISCGQVSIVNSNVPTVITIVNRKRLQGCRPCRTRCLY